MRDKWLPQTSEVDHRPLAALAARQHGVVSVRQLLSLGYSRNAVARTAAAGRLHRLHQGVYAVGHSRITVRGRCLAAVLACGRDAVLSHRSAAWLWGLWRGSPAPFDVTTTPTSRRSRPPLRIHRARGLMPNDRALADGIPVTAVPRTLLDLAATVRFDRLERVIERAEELRLFDLGPIDDLLARSAGHPGVGPLRRAIALYRPAAFTRSNLERRFLALVEAAGLPRPLTGFNELGYELDVYWPQERFAVELDTFATHGTREAFERDRLRQEDLKLVGIEMVRVTDQRLEQPEQVIARLRRHLEQRHSPAREAKSQTS